MPTPETDAFLQRYDASGRLAPVKIQDEGGWEYEIDPATKAVTITKGPEGRAEGAVLTKGKAYDAIMAKFGSDIPPMPGTASAPKPETQARELPEIAGSMKRLEAKAAEEEEIGRHREFLRTRPGGATGTAVRTTGSDYDRARAILGKL